LQRLGGLRLIWRYKSDHPPVRAPSLPRSVDTAYARVRDIAAP
jgi:hypothetical protein